MFGFVRLFIDIDSRPAGWLQSDWPIVLSGKYEKYT